MTAYPNPYNPKKDGALYIGFTAAQKDPDKVAVKLFTPGFRLVKEFVLTGAEARSAAGRGYVQLQSRQLSNLAAGTYYFTVTLYKDAKAVKSRIAVLTIVK